jgi:four helix bundle protein
MTALFPQEEKYCLTRQIRIAVVSVASNIAEGSARNHSKELQQFLFHALGSVAEVETQLEIAYRMGYIKSYDHEMEKLTRIRKMLVGLIKAIRKRIQDN